MPPREIHGVAKVQGGSAPEGAQEAALRKGETRNRFIQQSNINQSRFQAAKERILFWLRRRQFALCHLPPKDFTHGLQ